MGELIMTPSEIAWFVVTIALWVIVLSMIAYFSKDLD